MYPPSNRDLWTQVAARGAVLSESALGTKPHPGVFPARNRIIAALSDVVVVVESHRSGGSLYTADAAARRSIPVCAVPGSVRSRASDGTNALLVDGCTPVRDVTDVLVAVSLARAGVEQIRADARLIRQSREPGGSVIDGVNRSGAVRAEANPIEHDPAQGAVLAAVDDVPTRFETILIRTGLSIASAATACDQLSEQGSLVAGAGWWSLTQDDRHIGRN